jgi:hypothetical protein
MSCAASHVVRTAFSSSHAYRVLARRGHGERDAPPWRTVGNSALAWQGSILNVGPIGTIDGDLFANHCQHNTAVSIFSGRPNARRVFDRIEREVQL